MNTVVLSNFGFILCFIRNTNLTQAIWPIAMGKKVKNVEGKKTFSV